MEQFVSVRASVYNNKCLKTQTVTTQELPKYLAEQNPRYKIDSPKKKINKKLSAKADSLVDKTLYSPRIKLSNSRTLILDVVETGVLQSDFARQLCDKNADIPDIYFNLVDAVSLSPTFVLNQNAKAIKTGSWVPFKI